MTRHHRNPIKPLTIVDVGEDDKWGVVTGYDSLRRRYHVRLVKQYPIPGGDVGYAAAGDRTYRRGEIYAQGFCENDYHPRAILCAAAGYGAHGATWYAEAA